MNKEGLIHVLIIDDNEDILSMLQAMLEHQGYKTTILDKTYGLVQIVKDLQPDIILMDKLYPVQTGVAFVSN